jgi:hypothetical protein
MPSVPGSFLTYPFTASRAPGASGRAAEPEADAEAPERDADAPGDACGDGGEPDVGDAWRAGDPHAAMNDSISPSTATGHPPVFASILSRTVTRDSENARHG